MQKRNLTFPKLILAIAALLLQIFGVSLYAGVSLAEIDQFCCEKLNGELSATQQVIDYQVSEDGTFAVYAVIDAADDSWALFRAATDKSSAPVQIDQGQAAGNSFNQLLLSPDGARVVVNTSAGLLSLNSAGTSYVWLKELVGSENRSIFNDAINASSDWVIFSLYENQSETQVEALFSVPIIGGESIRLTPDTTTYNWLNKPLLSPAGDRVVYGIGDQDSGVSGAVENAKLYSVPIEGGNSQLLDQVASGYQTEINISADGKYVVFGIVKPDQIGGEYLSGLNSVAITGGEKIDLTAGASAELTRIFEGYKISSDSQNVVFFADQGAAEISLYSSAIDGNRLINVVPYVENMIELSPNLFHITPDGSDIIFLGHVGGNILVRKTMGFYRVAVQGGEIVTLYKRTTQRYGQISSDFFAIDPTGQYLIFVENDALTINIAEFTTTLRTVSLSGEEAMQTLASGIHLPQSGDLFQVSPNGRRILFWSAAERLGDQMPPIEGALFSVPISGGSQIKLSDVNGSGEVSYGRFSVTADSHQVVYLGEDEQGQSGLYVSQAAGENVAPEFTSQAAVAAFADRPLQFQIRTQDGNQTDTLMIEAAGLPDWATFTDNGDGMGILTGTPTLSELGQSVITLTVTDQFGLKNDQPLTLNVVELAAEIYLPTINLTPGAY